MEFLAGDPPTKILLKSCSYCGGSSAEIMEIFWVSFFSGECMYVKSCSYCGRLLAEIMEIF
jgi:hypothetical protein